MADTKISALTSASSVDGTELIPIVQGGVNKKATVAVVKASVLSDPTLLKTSAIGATVQGYNADTVIDANYVHTDNNYTTVEKSKLSGISDGAEVNVNADWNAVAGDAQILNKPTLGTASSANSADFATAAQGIKADAALQPAAIGVTVQAYDADLTSWSGIAPSAKQDALVSGTNIKTVNSASLLGPGDVAVQPTLVSGTNIKTINGSSILASGNLPLVASDNAGITGADAVTNLISMTQAEYDAIGTKSASTLYIIAS